VRAKARAARRLAQGQIGRAPGLQGLDASGRWIRRRCDGDIAVVLGRRADHGRAADVDVLDARRRNRRPRRRWPRTDRGRPDDIDGPMPWSAMACACSGASRTPSRPPCTTGCRVLTRPSIISGKPVRSATSLTGRPKPGDGGPGAAGRDQLDAGGVQDLGGLDQAGLVGDRQQGALGGDEIGGGRIVGGGGHGGRGCPLKSLERDAERRTPSGVWVVSTVSTKPERSA
jgi:hypothetical protein